MIKYLKNHFQSLPANHRRVFTYMLVLAVGLAIFSTQTYTEFFAATNLREFTANGIPMFVGVLLLVSCALIWIKQPIAGSALASISVQVSMLVIPMLAEGYGTVTAVVSFLVSAFIGNQVLFKKTGYALIGAGFFSVATLMVDTFWPFQRIGTDTQDIFISQIIAWSVLAILIVLAVRQFRNALLRDKLLIGFGLLAILPMIAIGILSNRQTSAVLNNDARQALLSSAAQVTTQLDTFIASNLDSLRIEAQLDAFPGFLSVAPVDRALSSEREHALRAMTALNRKDPINIVSYALLDNLGTNVLDTASENMGFNEGRNNYFQHALQTGLPQVSPVQFYSDAGEVLVFSAPVRSGNGEILGVLRVRYDAAILQQIAYEAQRILGADSQVVFLDENKTILAHSSEPKLLFKNISLEGQATLSSLIEQKRLPLQALEEISYTLPALVSNLDLVSQQPYFNGELDKDADAVEVIGAGLAVNQPWYVLISRPSTILLQPIRQQTQNMMLLGVVIAAIAISIGILVAFFIARPLSNLTQVANQIAAGDLSIKAQAAAQDEIGILGSAFNSMTSQLQILIGTLEQRVADRTKALATSTEVSRRLSTILDQPQLVREVVDQLQSAFGYYHAHIYLFDPNKQALLMAGGTGEAGRTLLARGHKIEPGRGLVGRAAASNSPVLVPDVALEPGWLPNPLLPETRAEVAVPIAIGNEVIGVLDVQHNITGGLEQQDADLLQSIASQVAIALRNAQAYTTAQSQAQREALAASISQRIQNTSSVDEALKVAARELGRAIGSDYTAVRLTTAEKSNGQH